jgi:hypothetical protein
MDDAYHFLQERGLQGNHCVSNIGLNGLTDEQAISSNHLGETEAHSDSTADVSGKSTNGSATAVNGCAPTVNGSETTTNGTVTTIAPGVVSNGAINNHSESPSSPQLLVWSAPEEKSLERVVLAYGPYYKSLIGRGRHNIERLAFTLGERRSCMPWRTFAVVGTPQEIENPGLPQTIKSSRISEEPKLAFIFTGQGSQYVEMGMQLMHYKIFKETLQHIDTIYKELGSQWSVFGTYFQ